MIFNTVTGGGEKGFVPTIVVNVDTGSTVTCSNGSKTFTATSVGGTCSFEIPSFDTWVVTATLSGESATQNVIVNEVKVYTINLYYTQIYGVEWDGSSTTSLTRTDNSASFTDPVPALNSSGGSSPFDNCYPWNGMTVSSDSEAGSLVAIPKFYYKWTRSGTTMKLQIADKAVDGFSVSPAHQDRGDGKGERDVVYVGKYHCGTSDYKSTTGVAQKCSITRSAARTGISNLGSTIWQWDYAMVWTIRMLYLVEFANWNSQSKIGYGCSASGSKANNGQTDSISYHTGTTASSRTTYGYTKYRNIEGLWDNVLDWCDGIYYTSSGQYIIKNPANFSDSANGTLVSSLSNGSGATSAWSTPSTEDWALLPSAFNGDSSNYTTYITDSGSVYSSSPCVGVGGSYSRYQYYGLFCLYCSSSSSSYDSIGCRLQKLP